MPPGSEQPELSPAGISGLELRILNFPLRVATLLGLGRYLEFRLLPTPQRGCVSRGTSPRSQNRG